MIGSPLRLRKKALASIINPAIGVLEVVEVFRANCADDISRRLKVILAEFGEGLVIKHPESLYILGGREPTWVKVKPGKFDLNRVCFKPQINGLPNIRLHGRAR